MKLKYFITASLLAAVVGLAVQFLGDFFCWHFIIGDKTAYQHITEGLFERGVEQSPPALRPKKAQLMMQGLFLFWLTYRGERAFRMAALLAIVGASSFMLIEHAKEARKAVREASS